MMDRSKVIEGIGRLLMQSTPCGDCPIYELLDDAYALLKENENIATCENCAMAIEDRKLVVLCNDCMFSSKHVAIDKDGNHLLECKRWHKESNSNLLHSPNWYCADGVKRDD